MDEGNPSQILPSMNLNFVKDQINAMTSESESENGYLRWEKNCECEGAKKIGKMERDSVWNSLVLLWLYETKLK